MTNTLVEYSLIAVYSSMAIYALAFIMFTLDLSRRAAAAPAVVAAPAQLVAAGGSTAVLVEAPVEAEPTKKKTPRFLRAATALTILAWVLHVSGTVMRGVAAGRVPWVNMFEFTLTATTIIIGVFLVVQLWQDIRFIGAFVTGFVLVALGVATVNFYVDVIPLPPSLQSMWLIIHVFVASLATGFFAVGASLSAMQLLQARRESGKGRSARFLATLPSAEKLEAMAYRMVVVGFVFWTFTLIAGAIWAERAWGRYWGWDTKEVWTFVVWTLFAGYIHARATRGWRGSRSAWLAIIGLAAVIFNFTVVNLFFKGLHAYSGIPGVT